ncbi:MAG: AFG1 family ATPase [Wenzhouxiangella sp.]|nr:MAG: AFG1 family ATPase [Wenzhouxiangella sp.]
MGAEAASGPLHAYTALVEQGRLSADPAQQRLTETLQQRFETLLCSHGGVLARLRRKRKPVRGLYLHGKVGRGKTMLMDLFAACLLDAGIPVWRIHFHRFMDHVHGELAGLEHKRDPLATVARRIADRAGVLCFDEFHVGDIGDAMILGELLRHLFGRVTLVATSNTIPDQLYADGLQRARFLPAIEAIKRHCDVINLDAEDDYRLRELVQHPVYYAPQTAATLATLEAEFAALAAGERISTQPIKIRGHVIEPIKRAGPVAWFDFATLCEGPRASADYIELARRFGTIVISDIPQLDNDDNDATRRFIHFVDECYDRAVKLIISAEVEPQQLYRGKRLAAVFERTRSRLIEMQSRAYLALPHRP